MKRTDHIKLDCASCGKCCKFIGEVKPDLASVYLTVAEQKRFGKKSFTYDTPIEGGFACEFYGEDGCTLDMDDKPTQCRLFPLIPARDGGVIVAQDCPQNEKAQEFDLDKIKLTRTDRSHLATLAQGPKRVRKKQ